MYKPKPTDKQLQEEGRTGDEGWAALFWRIPLGLIERRRRARIIARLPK
jgi:hypothetical protein